MNVVFVSRYIDATQLAPGVWQTNRAMYYHLLEDGKPTIEIVIGANFVTDFCSVPRIPFAYLMFGGLADWAGMLHDSLYSPWTGVCVNELVSRKVIEITRSWADDVLEAALKACGIDWFSRKMMYAAVRLKGGDYYKKPPLYEQGVQHWGLDDNV